MLNTPLMYKVVEFEGAHKEISRAMCLEFLLNVLVSSFNLVYRI